MDIKTILKNHKVDIKEENVIIACKEGTIELSLDDGKLAIDVSFTDRVIHLPDINIDELI